MPRIEPVREQEAPAEIRAVFEELKKTKWRIPTMYRVLAHHPDILRAHERYFDAVMNQGVLERRLKEKVAYKVARLDDCAYSSASHYRYALKCGATEKEMEDVDGMRTGSMPPKEAAALKLAEAMSESGKKVSEGIFAELRRHFSSNEIIELLAVVGLMAFASRLADALGLEPDR